MSSAICSDKDSKLKAHSSKLIALLSQSILNVKVRPRSSKSEVLGVKDGVLLVALKAPPEDGKANKELLHLLHKEFGGQFLIVRGATSRMKVVKRRS